MLPIYRYLPNLITVLRCLLVFPILRALFQENYAFAFHLFMIGGLSDCLDGQLARYFGWETQIGAWLDPLADKVLVMSTFFTLSYLSKIPWWVTSVVLVRDIWIMLGVLMYRLWIGPLNYKPIFVSKLNTVLQVLFILLTLYHEGFKPITPAGLHVLGIAMLITSIVSFVQYTWIWGKKAWFIGYANSQ